MSEEKKLNRRDFLGIATWGIGGVIGAAFGLPAIAFIIGPAAQGEDTEDWIPLGLTSKVEIGTPTLFKARIERQAGWIVNETEISVYVLTDNGRDFVAMSNICTHLGCRVRWIGDEELFFCPCHNAAFAKDGSVVSGPPPRPLDQFEVKIEDGQLYILGG